MTDERAFVRMIAAEPGDGGTRLVYADWLEEQGEADQAAFLRLEAQLAHTPVTHANFARLTREFQALHARLDPLWLARIDRTEVENCFIQFEVPCPKRWERLRPTADDGVRFCETCRKNVYHCATIESARGHARADHCVAVDSRLARQPGDLYHLGEEHTLMGVVMSLPEEPTQRFLPLRLPARVVSPPPPAPRRRWWEFWK
jgi:uncharacterized protein (TIGR02996 family)